jgi:hypothetical protein
MRKKTTICTSKNSHKHQIISCTCRHILLSYCIVEILGGQSSEHIGVERGRENWRKLELVLRYIRGKFPPNSNCCFQQRDVSGSIIATWMMMTKKCSIFNGEDLLMLRFSNTKSSMLYKLVSMGKADWIVFNDL